MPQKNFFRKGCHHLLFSSDILEFIDFVDSVLPSVSPDLRDSAKSAILQFERTGETLKYMMLNPLKELSQGDIISKVPFSFFDESGYQKLFIADALVLSTSCHIDQKDKILLAPVFPLDAFDGNLTDLKRNIIYDYMYLPDPVLSDKFIDFEYINTYHTADQEENCRRKNYQNGFPQPIRILFFPC